MAKMTVSKYFPEVTATSAFFPMGVFMGYIMQYHFAGIANQNHNMQRVLIASQWWPWVVGSSAAILTGFSLFGVKIKYQQYRYEHFHYLNIGMLLFFVSAILFMNTTIPFVPIYMSFIAHGICYIAALSYLNIRMEKSKFRFVRLSIPLVFYMFSVAIGATVVYGQMNFLVTNSSTVPVNDVIGILLLISSICTISCILILEYNNYYSKLNYRSSLDEDINRENTNLSILQKKIFVITSYEESVQVQPMANNKWTNNLLFVSFVIISKITSIMFFYWPFMFIHHIMSMASKNYDLFSINWFGVTGVIISTICLLTTTYKRQHFIGMAIKITFMFLLLIIFFYEGWFAREITVIMWFLFLALGFAYPNCDVNILSFTQLKYTEIVLTIGYVVLNITVGTIQYITIRTPQMIISLGSSFQMMYPHALAFLIILMLLIVIGAIIMPTGDCISLLELQNYINTYSLFGLESASTSEVQIGEREPMNNSPNIPVNTTMPMSPIYRHPGVLQQNIQVPSQQYTQQYMPVVVQQPPPYSTINPEPEQLPPPYHPPSPVVVVVAAGGSRDEPKTN